MLTLDQRFEIWYILESSVSWATQGLMKVLDEAVASNRFRNDPRTELAKSAGRFFKKIEERRKLLDLGSGSDDLDLTTLPSGRVVTNQEVKALLNPNK